MELNGIHLLTIQVTDMQRKNLIQDKEAIVLLSGLKLMDRYLTAIVYCPSVKWHEVRDNPTAFPTQGELNERLFKIVKASDNSKQLVCEELQRTYPNHFGKGPVHLE